jgi:hypothetical protein
MLIREGFSIVEQAREAIARIGQGLADFHRSMQEQAPAIEKRIAEFDPEMSEFLRCVPQSDPMGRKIALSTMILAQEGWYFSFWETGIAEVAQAASAFARGDREAADSELSRHIESLVPSMCLQLKKAFPTRLPIIEDALDAHRSGKYTLTIPVFLVQADGIGAALLGVD